MHIHINNVTEADAVWQNYLNESNKNVKNILYGVKKTSINQQLEQIGMAVNATSFLGLLDAAKEIRAKLFSVIFDCKCFGLGSGNSSIHPFASFFSDSNPNFHFPNKEIRFEVLMYVLVFSYLSKSKNDSVAKLFHKYLLINGFFMELFVYNPLLFGFEQFQNFTRTSVRDVCDKYIENKFFQLAGNRLDYLSFAEFRFSPAKSLRGNMEKISEIEKAWQEFLIKRNDICCGEKKSCGYSLIAHFIKTKDDNSNEYVRFGKLRTELKRKAEALIALKNTGSDISKLLVGIDAASSEFDAPPEVFSYPYRYLRKSKLFTHFTYHAGEDFYHIFSGLRAIYEVVDFLELKNGDRIGHATAAGVDVNEWIDLMKGSITIPIGTYLDDLVFVYFFVMERNVECLLHSLPKIALKIQELSLQIYEEVKPVELLIQAWKLRKYEFSELKSTNQKKRLLSKDSVLKTSKRCS